MYFQDEYEYETSSGLVFFVEIEGHSYVEDGQVFTEVEEITIYDSLSNQIDNTNEYYSEIHNDALNRDYEVEEHGRDFDYYKDDFNNFLQERDE